MTYAGIAQQTERSISHREGAGKNPAPRSTITRAVVAGLALDDAAREAGRRDGAARAPKRPPEGGDTVVLAYYIGYAAGELYG